MRKDGLAEHEEQNARIFIEIITLTWSTKSSPNIVNKILM